MIDHHAKYTLNAVGSKLSATFLAGETGPIIMDGVAGNIETVGRPGRDALTVHTGSNPIKMDVPILIEGYERNEWKYVEDTIRNIQAMAGFNPDGDRKPFGVILEAPGKLNPFPNQTWWLENPVYGDHIYNTAGFRIRQYMTLSLIQKVSDRALNAKSLRKLVKKKAPLRVKANKGETLRAVIKRVYGKKQPKKEFLKRVREAKKVNSIADAHKKFTEPRELLLPPRG